MWPLAQEEGARRKADVVLTSFKPPILDTDLLEVLSGTSSMVVGWHLYTRDFLQSPTH